MLRCLAAGLSRREIDELRAGRDNLLDAYRVVKRTFLEATEALAAGMPETLRTEIEQLLAQGRWFDATDRYREAAGTDQAAAFHEVGDVLFAAVNVARKLKVDPELALRAAADRFRGIELKLLLDVGQIDDPHGLVDSFLYGVSLNKIARQVDDAVIARIRAARPDLLFVKGFYERPLRDGSGVIQCVVFKKNVPEEVFAAVPYLLGFHPQQSLVVLGLLLAFAADDVYGAALATRLQSMVAHHAAPA